ncbi:MAG: archaellin/type IV pilin N-terminal domain-containing protein, partial [Candidatus Aenigmatarchaeota archaeon]
MKAISAFVATILLVGFTVAVGAIISTWFLTYTRTTTAGVGSATACAAGMLDVFIPSISTNGDQVIIQTLNRGSVDLKNVTISVICGTASNGSVIP